ncbi:hypothetical protein TTHERM_01232250 (macronuclear) [Tetrahymena thermophila SB210]|uniref:Kinase domain protein n=1 Tax=Tetrahymena thermophila (strain SB210) TaxID=312017 RepID=Q24DG2_TETTS|nr:hypothetical protein TTHERM_01232250 [Tetrahymena thermophila SB210]EAS05816.1 hypothetical protein TTHERM_01232250 [Tetrahymena thermophila SB210]|eukprot:XP_001026061.1 hypothetical protein TTHERM_01232250 [Tetrahymena thermophila SB210]
MIGAKGLLDLGNSVAKLTNLYDLALNLRKFICFQIKSENQLGAEEIKGLCEGLAKSISISKLTLDLKQNYIEQDGISDFGLSLANCTNLSDIALQLEQLNEEGIQDLCITISKNNNLQNLQLQLKQIILFGSYGFQSYTNNILNEFESYILITINPHQLNEEIICESSSSQLFSCLSKCVNLKNLKLCINSCGLDKDQALALSQAFERCTYLKKVYLSQYSWSVRSQKIKVSQLCQDKQSQK